MSTNNLYKSLSCFDREKKGLQGLPGEKRSQVMRKRKWERKTVWGQIEAAKQVVLPEAADKTFSVKRKIAAINTAAHH